MILEYVRKEPHWSHPSPTLCLRGLLGAGEMKQRGLKKGFGTGGIVSCYLIIIDQKEFASFIRAVLDVERCHRWVTWCTSGPETGAKGGGKDHNLGFNLIYFLMVKLLHLKSKYENKPLQNYLIGKSIVFLCYIFSSTLMHQLWLKSHCFPAFGGIMWGLLQVQECSKLLKSVFRLHSIYR